MNGSIDEDFENPNTLRVIVQIPCHNEASTLKSVIDSIPRSWNRPDGRVVNVFLLLIDDGSRDGSSEIARDLGVDIIQRFEQRQGLARAFSRGLERSLTMGAEVIVNIDGDGQYKGEEIPKLVDALLDTNSDLVLGVRPIATTPLFSFWKRRFQVWGTALVRFASGLHVSDATTGFRAYSRRTALRLNVHTNFTYTLETLLQAGDAKLMVTEVPITMQEVSRPSRLARSTSHYLLRSLQNAPRMLLLYRPFATFVTLGSLLMAPGILLGVRYLYFHWQGTGGHIQSLILTTILILMGFALILLGLLGEVIAGNRRILEETLMRSRHLQFDKSSNQASTIPQDSK